MLHALHSLGLVSVSRGRGGSRLTPEGAAFLADYARYRDRCAEENRLLWQREFSRYDPET